MVTKSAFRTQTGEDACIKIMTDGILLAEAQGDGRLREYDTIIVDEAHERSLNIDFVLGILKTLIHRRRDLKLIITSATIDTEKFSKAFDAPIIEVSARYKWWRCGIRRLKANLWINDLRKKRPMRTSRVMWNSR
ncbi:MAG: hypothetical protein R2941_22405 [Desulfobacterales bacterium]